jgi:hypothetical protein
MKTICCLALAALLYGCQSTATKEPEKGASASKKMEAMKEPPRATAYALPGFAVYELDGRLWVFRQPSKSLVEFTSKGEPAKRVSVVGEGPDGKTVMSYDRATIDAYLETLSQ